VDYQVITAMDGAQAVAAARKEKPDLILLDIGFPPDVTSMQWDGFHIMKWFHRLDAAKKSPISSSTGSEDLKMRNASTARGP
jgi:CheY-like chemotaxis protein